MTTTETNDDEQKERLAQAEAFRHQVHWALGLARKGHEVSEHSFYAGLFTEEQRWQFAHLADGLAAYFVYQAVCNYFGQPQAFAAMSKILDAFEP